MPFSKVKCAAALLSILLLCAAGATANEKAEGGGAAAKEGGATKSPQPGEPITKEQKEFYDKSSRLMTLTNRISSWDHEFESLVKKKAATKDHKEKQRLIQEMVAVTKERNKDAAQYNQIKADLTYRFPNQGNFIERRYQTQNKKSVQDIEGVAGLDELLTRTKKIIEKKFAPFAEEEQAKAAAAGPHGMVPTLASPQPVEEKPKRLRLEK